jgi:hypothetical protein
MRSSAARVLLVVSEARGGAQPDGQQGNEDPNGEYRHEEDHRGWFARVEGIGRIGGLEGLRGCFGDLNVGSSMGIWVRITPPRAIWRSPNRQGPFRCMSRAGGPGPPLQLRERARAREQGRSGEQARLREQRGRFREAGAALRLEEHDDPSHPVVAAASDHELDARAAARLPQQQRPPRGTVAETPGYPCPQASIAAMSAVRADAASSIDTWVRNVLKRYASRTTNSGSQGSIPTPHQDGSNTVQGAAGAVQVSRRAIAVIPTTTISARSATGGRRRP